MPSKKAPHAEKRDSHPRHQFLSQVIYHGNVWEVLWQQGDQVCIRSITGGLTCVVNVSRLRPDISWETGS